MAHITLLIPSGRQKIELEEHNTIGRHPGNRIALADPSVSKHHCLISMDGNGTYFIEDKASANGTFVNRQRIQTKTAIHPGDEIRLGNLHMLFGGDEQTAARMVEIGETHEGLFTSTLSPRQQTGFLPETHIANEQELRTDYEKLRVTYELQNEMNLERNIRRTLDRILDRTFQFLEFDQGVILLADAKGNMVPNSYKARLSGEKFTISRTLVQYIHKEKTGVISTDVPSDDRFNIAESIMMKGVKSTIAAPMMIDDEILGIMILHSFEKTDAFSFKDLGLITAVAGQAARIIKNAKLHEELRLAFDSSIRTLSATVDARHPLTAGHSERVKDISIMIASQMGLQEQEIRILTFAALMHDIGKIAIPDAVLLKNGRFNADEKAIMDLHPSKSREILDNFYFPELLKTVPLIAGSHHEKMDGTGYPRGLKGHEIPLASRIMAVADVFDALTARRDYPKYTDDKTVKNEPLSLEEVTTLIKKGSGRHFDARVVGAFLECLSQILERFKNSRYLADF